MAKMSLKPDLRRPNPLSAWREAHGLTLAQLAEKLGVTVGAVHQIEDEQAGNYNRAWLEALADLYRRQPADLISGPPGQADPFIELWRQLSEPQRQRVAAYAEGLLADQPPPPAPQPPPAAPSNRVTPRFKEQPELPTIGQGGTVRYYLLDWMDYRNMEPEDLVKRLPDWDLADLKRVLAGRFEPPDDLIHYAAKALRTTEAKLRETPPPLPARTAKKEGKRTRQQ